MGRELLRDVSQNGVVDRLPLDDDEAAVTETPTPPEPAVQARQLREVRRDRVLSHIVVLVLEATRTLEPLLEVISARLLRWAALGASIGLAFVALRNPSWERAGILAVFMILVTLLLRKIP